MSAVNVLKLYERLDGMLEQIFIVIEHLPEQEALFLLPMIERSRGMGQRQAAMLRTASVLRSALLIAAAVTGST